MRVRRIIPSVVMLAAGCGGPRISSRAATAIIEGAKEFKAAKIVYVPHLVAIPADGLGASMATKQGEALTLTEIAAVDPVVAVLRARDRVSIEDFVSAVPGSELTPQPATPDSVAKRDSTKSPKDSTKAVPDSTKAALDSARRSTRPRLDEPHTSPPPQPPLAQAWTHTIRVTPRPQLQSAELLPDDGDDNPETPRVVYPGRPMNRTPGWTLAVGTREVTRILDVIAYTPTHGEPAGEAQIDFVWRWHATKPGAPFDEESAEFQSLPREVQQAALTGQITVNGTNHWSRATVTRDGKLWRVTGVNWSYGDDKPHSF